MMINSEIGKLRKVIVHRPRGALERLTPSNCHELLFDDVIFPEKAAEEHKVFEGILQENGSEILLLEDLLHETMENIEAREWVIRKLAKRLYGKGTAVHDDIINLLLKLSSKEISDCLIRGITCDELNFEPKGLTGMLLREDDFVIPPLPNSYFTRDTSCWVGRGVSINPMYWPARRGETLNIAAIYKFHPFFKNNDDFSIWYDGSEMEREYHPIEGGDVHVISKDCALVGISIRTTPQAIETLAKALFAKGDKKKIITIEIPKARSSMHLDTVMTMINYDTFCIGFADADSLRSWTITPGDLEDELVITKNKDPFQAIASEVGVSKLNLITLGGTKPVQEREQWTDASNLLSIAPGVVIGYKCNVHTNKKLKSEGIEVLSLDGSELGRGRGGARCMSCPIERDSL